MGFSYVGGGTCVVTSTCRHKQSVRHTLRPACVPAVFSQMKEQPVETPVTSSVQFGSCTVLTTRVWTARSVKDPRHSFRLRVVTTEEGQCACVSLCEQHVSGAVLGERSPDCMVVRSREIVHV
jgi:hypothetical protein